MNIIIRKISVTLNKALLRPCGSGVLWKLGLVFRVLLGFYFFFSSSWFGWIVLYRLLLFTCDTVSASLLLIQCFLELCWGLVSLLPRTMVMGFGGVGVGGFGGDYGVVLRIQHFSLRIFVEIIFCLFVLGLFVSACCVICCGNHWNATHDYEK